MQKNVAGQKIRVFAFDTTDNSAVTGDADNITIKVSNDWAALVALTDVNPTEVEDGYYVFDVTQAESNYDNIDVYPESSTANVQVIGTPATIVTTAAGATVKTGYSLASTGLDSVLMEDLAAVPSATGSIKSAINFVFQYVRNRRVLNKTDGEESMYKDDALTKLSESTVTDDGTEFDHGEWRTPT